MSQTTAQNPSTQNPLPAIIFLVVVTALMIYVGSPRPANPVASVVAVTPTVAVTAVAAVEPIAQATPEDHLMLMAMGLEQVNKSAVDKGLRLFNNTCIACHGTDAKGIMGLGKTLVGSDFVDSLNDDELVAFIRAGRGTTDPLNTTGVAMPASGNNPSLTDEELHLMVAYIRSLNGATVVNDISPDQITPVPTVRPFAPINVNGLTAGSSASSAQPTAVATVEATLVPTDVPATSSEATVAPTMGGFVPIPFNSLPDGLIAPSSGGNIATPTPSQ